MPSVIAAGTTSNTALNFTADTTGVLQLQTNGTTAALTIDTSQNVGIGTASPSGRLHVQNSAGTHTQIWGATGLAGSYAYMRLQRNASDGTFTFGTAQVGFSDIAFATSSASDEQFAERMRINTNGTIRVVSTIGVGNATPSTSGAGITFPATQSASSNANTLDDYEEGTWTPTITGGTTAGTTTYAVQQGHYTKIGDTVQIFGYVVISAANGSGELRLGGLPFTTSNVVYCHIAAQTGNLALTANNYCSLAETALNATHMVLIQSPVAGGSAATVVPISNSNIAIYFGGSYKVS